MNTVVFKTGTSAQLENTEYAEGTFYAIAEDASSTEGTLYADLGGRRLKFSLDSRLKALEDFVDSLEDGDSLGYGA